MRYTTVLLLAMILVACSDGADGADLSPQTTSSTTAPPDISSCAAFLDTNLGIAYDYTASTSPRDLADRADVVVDGRLTSAAAETRWVTFGIAVDDTLKGDPVDDITAAIEISPAINGDLYVRRLPEGARVVAFVDEDERVPGGHRLGGPEGFYVECPGVDTIHGSGPGWAEIDDLDDIVAAVQI